MRQIFADTWYWIASINPKDQWHAQALVVDAELNADLLTTEAVLIEVLNYFCGYGPELRLKVALIVEDLLHSHDVEVISHTRQMFWDGIALYRAREDKGYSLTDCISMHLMRERGITEILTHDHHFTQEGFTILL